MWVCDSNNHSIINTKGEKVALVGFTRGVTIGQSAIYVGSSGLSERNNRKDVDSEVLVLEPDYQLRGQIPVNGYGQILDIQLLISK